MGSQTNLSLDDFPQTPAGFYDWFTASQAALENRIDQLPALSAGTPERNAAVEHCLASISDLTAQLGGAGDWLPPHDQRVLSEKIKALSERLRAKRDESTARPKFSFKNRLKAGVESPRQPQPSTVGLGEVESSTPKEPSPKSAANVARLNDLSGHVRSLDLDKAAAAAPLVEISHATDSAINVSSDSHGQAHAASLSARAIHSSVLLCGPIHGPAHLTDVSRSVILVACRQFRMHQAVDCDVYLHCTSRPIIEGCSRIRLAPLPSELVMNQGISEANAWQSVDDFDWLRAEPSPNWSPITEDQLISAATALSLVSHIQNATASSESLLRDAGMK